MNRPRTLILLIVVLIGSVIGWLVLHKPKPAPSGQVRSIVVTTSAAATRDVPVWLTGLGTVRANNTVTVRPRAGGELQSIHFVEGQEVKAGDILAQIDPRPYRAALDQALAQKAQDEARLANDRREFDRVRGLVESNTESRQLLDQREATLAQSAALVQASQAAVDNARLQLDFTIVRAPIDGHTGVRLVDAGNIVTAGQSNGLVVLTQTKPIAILFTVPQQNFLDIRKGITLAAGVPLAVEAVSDKGHVLARGTLALIDNQIDTSTGTLRLKALFPNEDQSLWPGQFVNARVLVATLAQALVVPAEAVQPGLHGPFAYIVKPDATVEPRSLKLGPTVDGFTVVTAGLQPGESVVRIGQNKLKPGARVELRNPAATAPAASAE